MWVYFVQLQMLALLQLEATAHTSIHCPPFCGQREGVENRGREQNPEEKKVKKNKRNSHLRPTIWGRTNVSRAIHQRSAHRALMNHGAKRIAEKKEHTFVWHLRCWNLGARNDQRWRFSGILVPEGHEIQEPIINFTTAVHCHCHV